MRRELDRFLSEHAARLPEPFDGTTADIAVLAPLDALVTRADIVALGELNHFVHEKSDFRLFFARYLLSRGWTNFAEELGRSDGVRVDRFYASADTSELDRLPSFGHRTHLREDRDDRPTGLFRRSFETYPADLFRAEQGRFYRGLRTAAGDKRIRHFGFDIDGLPGGSYEDIATRLVPYAHDPGLNEFREALARVPGESAGQEAQRLRRIRPRETIEPIVGRALTAEIEADIAALADSLDYIRATYAAETYDAVRPGMAAREDMMKRRIAEIRALCGADKRLVLMAHAFHLAKDDGALRSGAQSIGPGGGLTPSLGHHLVRELGLNLVSIWFVYGGGEDSQPFDELPRHARYPKDTLNATLASLRAPLFFLTGRNESFAQPSKIGHMYNAVVETPLAVQADAAFFLPSVSRLSA